MDSVSHPGSDTYRLILTRRDAGDIMLLSRANAWSLPLVTIPRGQRIAEQLTKELNEQFGCRGFCLFVTNLSGHQTRCAVMEMRDPGDIDFAGACWMPLTPATCSWLDLSEDRLAVQESIEELQRFRREPRRGPLAKPGWLAELFEWAQVQIDPLNLRLSGVIRQLNASPTFSLIRLETDGPALWFKATGVPNSHELPITVVLARFFPGYIPGVIGVHHPWNGWLSPEVPGTQLGQFTDLPAWVQAAEHLAELQIASIERTADLLDAHAKDLRISRLAGRIDPFLAHMGELMAVQEKPAPKPLSWTELVTLGVALKESCFLLESCGLPDTVAHLDLNPGNILVARQRSVFLDWAEGAVANPLITFEYLRNHFSRCQTEDSTARNRLTDAYLHPWGSICSADNLRLALVVSPLLAIFAYAVAGNSWQSRDLIQSPALAGYFRSLTRRMHRESAGITEGSQLCLN